MMFRTRVTVTLLWLLVPLAHSFSWDFVEVQDKRLEFYYNGRLTHKEDIPSTNAIESVTYDPVNYRVLFADCNKRNISISSFDLSTRKIQPLVLSKTNGYSSFLRVVYDPVTNLIFWNNYLSIYSLSLNSASANKVVDGNLVVTLDLMCYDIAVDSCGGYIYWISNNMVERARFNGSEREVVINRYNVHDRRSLAIDQQTQKIYWPETKRVNGNYQLTIESADFNGKNRRTIHMVVNENRDTYGYALVVSKDFIYLKNYEQVGIWQLRKFPSPHEEGKLLLSSSDYSIRHNIAANYTIKEQIQGIKSCDPLKFLIRNNSKPESTISICQNYCFQGDCRVSTEEQPTCRCNAGYSGERCEVSACHNYCFNNGVCSLNEENEAVCKCTADYEGVRCDVATTCTGVHADNTTPQVLRDLYSAVKHTLQFYSDKIDKIEAQIRKNEKSIMDIKTFASDLENHDETTPKTQTFN